MRVLFMSRYDRDGASSRYRMLQYIPALRARGIECDHQPFFAYGYVGKRFMNKSAVLPQLALSYWNRCRAMKRARNYDWVIIEKEAFPFIPRELEVKHFLGKLRYAVDYDDAVFHGYDRHPNTLVRKALGDKISGVMAGASKVIVGSKYLYQYACQFNPEVHFIPTVVDLARYPAAAPSNPSSGTFTIGWIGSQATIRYLRDVEKTLDAFCGCRNARVVIIGGRRIPLAIRNLEWVPWSEETEVEELSRIDVGIMPLPEGSWEAGKCAFKLIQYMACWKPVVASAVGENRRVVENGYDGFLASGQGEWSEALDRLYVDRTLCKKMGMRGRLKVEQGYCLDIAVPKMINILGVP